MIWMPCGRPPWSEYPSKRRVAFVCGESMAIPHCGRREAAKQSRVAERSSESCARMGDVRPGHVELNSPEAPRRVRSMAPSRLCHEATGYRVRTLWRAGREPVCDDCSGVVTSRGGAA